MADGEKPPEAPKPLKPRYKPWPKKRDLHGLALDREKLHRQYLEGDKYSWADFCAIHNYDPSARKRQEFPFRFWQTEWLNRKLAEDQETAMEKTLEVKKFLTKERLNIPKEWHSTAQALKSMGDFLLSRELDAAQWDQEHAKDILEGRAKPKCKMTFAQYAFLAGAQKKVFDLNTEALLVLKGLANQTIIPLKDADPAETEAEAEGERLRNIPTALIGTGASLSREDIQKLNGQWVDQLKSVEASVEDPDDDENMNKPLDSLE